MSMKPKFSYCEQLYYSFLDNGELFKLDSAFMGDIDIDWDLWLKYYKLLNS